MSQHSVRFPGENQSYRSARDELLDAEMALRRNLEDVAAKHARHLHFMFGPKMAEACPLCTSILDGMDGEAPHIMQRVNFAVIAKSPIERIRKFARQRGWRNLPLLSSANNTYNHDLTRSCCTRRPRRDTMVVTSI